MFTAVLVLAPVFLVLLILAGLSLYLARIRRAAMQDAARELGLRWRAEDPRSRGEILGELEGLPVSVRVGASGVAGMAAETTSAEIVLPMALPFKGEIELDSKADKAARRVSQIFAGDDDRPDRVPFAERFVIRADDPDQVMKVFDNDALLLLQQFADNADDLLVLPNRLRWYRFDDAVQDRQVITALRAGVALASHFRRQRMKRTLEHARSRPPPG